MKTYVKTDYVPDDCDYLTVGKEYEYTTISSFLGSIKVDHWGYALICIQSCSHLGYRSWTVINR